jgi:predicted TIM-barrel fold metal-dependent hydrolase
LCNVFSNNFWITTSGNPNPALLCSVQETGVDRILFAVDWPFVVNPPGVEWMKTVPLCDEDKAKILSGNASGRCGWRSRPRVAAGDLI